MDKAEIENNPAVRALFPAVLPAFIFELVGGNHRAFVYGTWWYDLFHCNVFLLFINLFIVTVLNILVMF